MNGTPGVAEDVKAATTFPQLIRATAAAYGDDMAIRLEDEGVEIESASFAEIDRRSAELARGLIARGVGKGARIGFISGNGPNFAIMLAAIARTGAVAIPISTLIRGNELVRVLRQADLHGLILQRNFLGKDYVERVCEALPELLETQDPGLRIARTPYLRWIASTGDNLPPTIHDLSWITDGTSAVSEDLLREMESEIHATDQMIEIYTSGSMALPKGVKHNHGPVLFRAHYIARMAKLERGRELNAILPMFWIGGLMMYLMPNWTVGAVSLCTERTLVNSQTAMGSVLSDDDLKVLSVAPEPWWGLGMSETLGPYSYGTEFRAKGWPVCAPMDKFADRYEIRIADENDQPVGDGEIGEMQVRGYAVTPALHKIERSEYWTADGYYHTGDMCLVEGTRIHFVNRGGDMIKTASSNVSPAEVEMEMQTLETVHNAYVVGLQDKERGQIVVAAVVPRDGTTLDFAAIEAELKKRMSSYKVPRLYVEIARDEVPMLHSNKVSKRLVEKLLAERLGRETA
ncbi:MAG: class I adenylate-forming enzyme family protein [Novosphingobium sp.]|nr:class I adenylate-forming enzyme family protein [Novosphingobium sp.]